MSSSAGQGDDDRQRESMYPPSPPSMYPLSMDPPSMYPPSMDPPSMYPPQHSVASEMQHSANSGGMYPWSMYDAGFYGASWYGAGWNRGAASMYGSTGHGKSSGFPHLAPQRLDRPLRVGHINAALIPAGIEYWLAALRRYSNPSILQFLRTVVLTDWVDTRQVSRMGMAVEVGSRESVIALAEESDILLISDPGRGAQHVAEWILQAAAPPTTIFVAHGDGDYTRDRMAAIGPAVDHIVAVSEHVRREICSAWQATVILNGVDPARLVKTRPRHVSRSELGLGKDDFVVGFVGRFSEEKNANLVIDAVAQLPPRYKALLIGHGYMRTQLIEQALRSIPGRFVLLEGDGDLGDLYAAMDAFAVPSRLEGYGLVGMEAMMCGIPVIGTPCGMIADLGVDHVNAMVVEASADAIAAAAYKLGENPSLRRSVTAAAARLVNQCGYASQMARKYESLLTDLWLESTGGGVDADR